MNRLILPLVALLASTSLAVAAPEKMTDSQLDNVVAGWNPGGNECGIGGCGNNGWGNGWDDINAGSPDGGTAPSKMNNGSIIGYGDININPANSPLATGALTAGR